MPEKTNEELSLREALIGAMSAEPIEDTGNSPAEDVGGNSAVTPESAPAPEEQPAETQIPAAAPAEEQIPASPAAEPVAQAQAQNNGMPSCDHSPRARHPGVQSQVGFRKHHYEQS